MAQGEDVVSGRFTPKDLRSTDGGFSNAIRIFIELKQIGEALEQRFRAVQDLEFTVEKGSFGCCKHETKLSG